MVTFRKGDAGYEAARDATVWRANTPPRYPAVVVQAASVDDVIAAVKQAKAEGLKVGIKSGGHSWMSPHLRDGTLLIDLAALNWIEVDADASRVWVGPGAKGRHVNDALKPHGLMAATGHADSVACGGFLMCGGFGWNFREYGNGCANVTRIQVVTADGELITASETENPDWFWAARGAGPGYFGVVVGFEVRAVVRRPVMRLYGYAFDQETAPEAIGWFMDLAPQLPVNVEHAATAVSKTDDNRAAPTEFSIHSMGFFETEEEADAVGRLFDACPLKDRAKAAFVNVPCTLEDVYLQATKIDPEGYRFSVDNCYSDATSAEAVPLMAGFLADMPTPWTHSFFLYQGPRPAYLERDTALSAWGDFYFATYPIWDDPARDDEMLAWAVERMKRLAPIDNGEGQMNDENMGRAPRRYFSPAAEARLEDLRARFDPEGRFVSFLKPGLS